VAKGKCPHLGDTQIARALILSHAGKKPLARYRVTLSERSRPTTESVKCVLPPVVLLPKTSRANVAAL